MVMHEDSEYHVHQHRWSAHWVEDNISNIAAHGLKEGLQASILKLVPRKRAIKTKTETVQ